MDTKMANSISEELENFVKTNKKFRSHVRALANKRGSSWPIVIVDGYVEPKMLGNGPYTTGGRSPGYYSYNYWPNRHKYRYGKYHKSTRRIEVGAEWVLEQFLSCKFS